MLDWEEIKHSNDFIMFRTQIFGGWLVIAEYDALTTKEEFGEKYNHKGFQYRPAMTFVPDPNHEWELCPTNINIQL